MSFEWIKMRVDLQTHPKVVRILSAMRPHDVHNVTDKFRVIGGLHAVWSVFDTHSVDGVLTGYTPETLDHIIGWEGFATAMMKVGWLVFDGAETLSLPEFSEHNGQSAKRRAEDQKRKRMSRTCPQSVRNLSSEYADNLRTESGLEREREKKELKEGDAIAPPAGNPPVLALVEPSEPIATTRKPRAKNPAFDAAIGILGEPSLVAKKIRDCGADTVQWAVAETLKQGPADPKSYLLSLLTPDPTRVGNTDRQGFKLDAFGRRTGERGVVV